MTSRCICFFELMATMAISQRSHGWMLIDSPITAVFSPNLKNLPTNYLNEPLYQSLINYEKSSKKI